MSYEDYWNGDVEMTVYYRKAYILTQKRNNNLAWLNGRYIYDALFTVVPALRGLSKEPVAPYLEEPYPYTKEDVEEAKRKQALKQAQKFREYAEAKNAERRLRKEAAHYGND